MLEFKEENININCFIKKIMEKYLIIIKLELIILNNNNQFIIYCKQKN